MARITVSLSVRAINEEGKVTTNANSSSLLEDFEVFRQGTFSVDTTDRNFIDPITPGGSLYVSYRLLATEGVVIISTTSGEPLFTLFEGDSVFLRSVNTVLVAKVSQGTGSLHYTLVKSIYQPTP